MSAEAESVTGEVGVGMHERHLLRKDGNPLFQLPPADYGANAYLEARQRDRQELLQFHEDMRSVIQAAIELAANVESEVILELRARLDQLYTRCSGFGVGCGEHKQNIRKLIDLVMKAVWQAAANDPQARMELEQEEIARQQHFHLLEYPLVSDLVRPDTPIAGAELVPTLLHAAAEELEAVLWLFDPEQLRQISDEAERMLQQRKENGYSLDEAWDRLAMMRSHLTEC